MKHSLDKAAKELAAYLAFRAKQEGEECGLDARWILKQMKKGIVCFFGIEYDANGITGDFQRPDLFERWRGSRNWLH